jgi:hypothetical protein
MASTEQLPGVTCLVNVLLRDFHTKQFHSYYLLCSSLFAHRFCSSLFAHCFCSQLIAHCFIHRSSFAIIVHRSLLAVFAHRSSFTIIAHRSLLTAHFGREPAIEKPHVPMGLFCAIALLHY